MMERTADFTGGADEHMYTRNVIIGLLPVQQFSNDVHACFGLPSEHA